MAIILYIYLLDCLLSPSLPSCFSSFLYFPLPIYKKDFQYFTKSIKSIKFFLHSELYKGKIGRQGSRYSNSKGHCVFSEGAQKSLIDVWWLVLAKEEKG